MNPWLSQLCSLWWVPCTSACSCAACVTHMPGVRDGGLLSSFTYAFFSHWSLTAEESWQALVAFQTHGKLESQQKTRSESWSKNESDQESFVFAAKKWSTSQTEHIIARVFRAMFCAWIIIAHGWTIALVISTTSFSCNFLHTQLCQPTWHVLLCWIPSTTQYLCLAQQ